MKFVIAILAFFSAQASAQVSIDQPVSRGLNDVIYVSSADPSSAYYLPSVLIVASEPVVNEVDGEFRIFFDVSVDMKAYLEKAEGAKPLNLRILRGWDVSLDAKGSMDTPSRFKSRLVPLGDPGNMGEPIRYMFAVKKIGPKYGKESQALIRDLFQGAMARHLGSVSYNFLAQYGGEKYMAKTMVGIFSSGENKSPPNGIQSLSLSGPLVLKDSETGCWQDLQIGQICLKESTSHSGR